jgi:redox-sensitive bicupin YhaK (pirin superfamily)
MSWNPTLDPVCPSAEDLDKIETLIVPRARDLGGFEVRRALPAPRRQMVGPFIFFDQMGPAEFVTGQGIDVRPHPHIGLATVTYINAGRIVHRDSVGSLQEINPGDVNWMTAGRGIAHSERARPEDVGKVHPVGGFQTWVALPKDREEVEASFHHHGKESLPVIGADGATVRIIVGSLYGERAPVSTFSEMFYADVQLEAGASLPVDAEHEERAAYILDGTVEIAGDRFEAGRLLVFRPGDRLAIRAVTRASLMLLGGEPMDGPRHIWWNFVSSSKERIDAAREDWRAGRFDKVFGDEQEFIPLPEK